ncbi:MAG: hypothetical protein M1821_005480 [Bathelium mastoideum]|nr:MAG: hypothetical protein M1821_005480 [Bathelium mastoideum]KAI9691809.1 MAG: hypothetical protein M1822_007881 [Bathelium mastoideum]
MSTESGEQASVQSMPSAPAPPRVPFYFREKFATLIVRGNFMTLAAKPMVIDEGEWMAHQVVEQYRLLNEMLRIIQEVNGHTGMPICNPRECPTMSGGGGHTYTWLDQAGRPCRISAPHYIASVQRWIKSKIDDPNTFPIEIVPSAPGSSPNSASRTNLNIGGAAPIAAGPTSLNEPLSQLAGPADRNWLGKAAGFPEHFESDVRSMYKQMMRCYCHLYAGHWEKPFWHLNATKELNTCFIHFVNVGKLFGILDDKDMEPMKPLVDIWVEKGLLPTAVTNGSSSGSATPGTAGGVMPGAPGNATPVPTGQEGYSPAPQSTTGSDAAAGATGGGPGTAV